MARNPQRNAADPAQVKHMARAEEKRAELDRAATLFVMGSYEGRLFVWERIASAGVFRSIWDPSAKIHYNAGRQDYGHELLALVIGADEELYQQMEREARARARGEQRGAEAVQIASTTEGVE